MCAANLCPQARSPAPRRPFARACAHEQRWLHRHSGQCSAAGHVSSAGPWLNVAPPAANAQCPSAGRASALSPCDRSRAVPGYVRGDEAQGRR